MSTATSIILTVVLVAGGIGTYHFVVAEDAAPTTTSSLDPITLGERDLAALEGRVAALEGRGPVLQGSTTPNDLYDRIRVLEERLVAMKTSGPATSRVTADTTLPAPAATAAAAGNEVWTSRTGRPLR